jgi:hypothetical protein
MARPWPLLLPDKLGSRGRDALATRDSPARVAARHRQRRGGHERLHPCIFLQYSVLFHHSSVFSISSVYHQYSVFLLSSVFSSVTQLKLSLYFSLYLFQISLVCLSQITSVFSLSLSSFISFNSRQILSVLCFSFLVFHCLAKFYLSFLAQYFFILDLSPPSLIS